MLIHEAKVGDRLKIPINPLGMQLSFDDDGSRLRNGIYFEATLVEHHKGHSIIAFNDTEQRGFARSSRLSLQTLDTKLKEKFPMFAFGSTIARMVQCELILPRLNPLPFLLSCIAAGSAFSSLSRSSSSQPQQSKGKYNAV